MEKVEITLIPYGTHQLVVPKNLVEYVLPYASPLPTASPKDAVVGSIIYKNTKTPVVDLLTLQKSAESPAVDENKPSRLVVMNALRADLDCQNYAFIATGLPKILNVTEKTLVEQRRGEEADFFFSQVRIEDSTPHDRCYILDVMQLEQNLFLD